MHVTDTACELLSGMLERRGDVERCLRLSTHQGNYRFVLDEPIEQDIIFKYEERAVLVVSESVSRDLWGVTVDCSLDEGKRRLIFRKSTASEPLDVVKDDAYIVPAEWRATQHEQLLQEIADIGRQIAVLRGGAKSAFRDQLAILEAKKQEKWDAIRSLWAGDGGWHKTQNGKNGAAAHVRGAH